MVLADWTFDAGLTVTSVNDAPSGGTNPTLRLQTSSTSKQLATAGTINGIDCTGIRNGKLEGFINSKGAGGHVNALPRILFRYQDANNYLFLEFRRLSGIMNWHIGKRVAGVESDVNALTPRTGNFLDSNATWYQFRITWWSAAGKTWFRFETATVGGAFSQQGTDISDSADLFTGAGTKIGLGGFSVSGAEPLDMGFDDVKVYSA